MTATITELRETLAFSKAPRYRTIKPWAAPLACLNHGASRLEDKYSNIERDGPRRLDEGAVPYWKTLPRPIGHPIIEAMAKRHPGNRPLAVLAYMMQHGTDGLVGVCAVVVCLAQLMRGRGEYAGIVLSAHALHVSKAVVLAAPMLAIALL